MALSPLQAQILRLALRDGQVRTDQPSEVVKATRLNGAGLLSRDKEDGKLWYPTEKARALGLSTDASAPAVSSIPDGAVAVASFGGMDRHLTLARMLLNDGDVMAARQLAEGVYEQAKAGGRFSARMKLKESLEACHRIQADALSIEIKTKMLIAEEIEKLKAAGKMLKGRPKSIPDENAFTLEEIGLTSKELHDAKKWLDADRKTPGIAERAIAARLAQGLEPSRSNLRASIGTKSATKEERGANLYETGPEAMYTLLALEEFTEEVFEPACGKGAIVRMLEAGGHTVRISDLNNYGTSTADGVVQDVIDFRQTAAGEGDVDIVTNPPYGDDMNSFIAYAIKVHRPRKMALLLNINAYFGFEDPDRNFAMKACRPARIIAFARRLPMMHRDGWDGPEASSSMNTAWFIWERQADGGYGQQTIIDRVDWADFMPVAESEAA
jgi:hypothetical protein